ncbi:MAG: hypothetical protein RR623_06460 [Bacilli bacterium]
MDNAIKYIGELGFPITMSLFLTYFTGYIIIRLLKQLDRFGDSLEKFNSTLLVLDKRVEQIEDKLGG